MSNHELTNNNSHVTLSNVTEQWCVFSLFAFTIFIKGVLFHWNCYHSVLISSLWHAPAEFFRFWGGKLMPALFLAFFVFLSKKNWWTIARLVLET